MTEQEYNDHPALRFTTLKRFISETARQFKYGPPQKFSAALDLGVLIHTAFLEPHMMAERFRPYLEKNPSTGKPYGPTSAKYQKWRDKLDPGVLPATTDDIRLAHDIAEYLEDSGEVVLPPENYRELAAVATIRGVECKARCDWMRGHLYDLKSAVDLTKWDVEARKKYLYPLQDAFYSTVFDKALEEEGLPPTDGFRFIVINKVKPLDILFREQDIEDRNRAKEEIAYKLDEYKACVEDDIWPGHCIPGVYEPF